MRTVKLILVIAQAVVIACGGCAAKREHNIITQISTIDAILAGSYGGVITVERLTEYGDTGIGTFDSLNGEMAVIEGQVYQVKGDGEILYPQKNATSPFASMVWFKSDIRLNIADADFNQLSEIIQEAINAPNTPAAVTIEGEFEFVHTRSVPEQNRPYPPLVEVVKNQPEFKAQNVEGKVVGFLLPPLAGKINVPGFHLHFIASDRSIGGHLLDIKVKKATVNIDLCNELRVKLPIENPDFAKSDLKTDRTEELMTSEK